MRFDEIVPCLERNSKSMRMPLHRYCQKFIVLRLNIAKELQIMKLSLSIWAAVIEPPESSPSYFMTSTGFPEQHFEALLIFFS
jgi:hypothetical protein